jgi:hypothetical protein
MLEQYREILNLLQLERVDRQRTEDWNEWRERLIPAVRTAWEQSSLGWKLPESGPTPPRATATSGRQLTSEELEDALNRPVITEPVVLPEERLRAIVVNATSRLNAKERRRSTRSRLAYRLLAERWGISPAKIRGRVERMQSREKKTK